MERILNGFIENAPLELEKTNYQDDTSTTSGYEIWSTMYSFDNGNDSNNVDNNNVENGRNNGSPNFWR